jgi:hypothetical protein
MEESGVPLTLRGNVEKQDERIQMTCMGTGWQKSSLPFQDESEVGERMEETLDLVDIASASLS